MRMSINIRRNVALSDSLETSAIQKQGVELFMLLPNIHSYPDCHWDAKRSHYISNYNSTDSFERGISVLQRMSTDRCFVKSICLISLNWSQLNLNFESCTPKKAAQAVKDQHEIFRDYEVFYRFMKRLLGLQKHDNYNKFYLCYLVCLRITTLADKQIGVYNVHSMTYFVFEQDWVSSQEKYDHF